MIKDSSKNRKMVDIVKPEKKIKEERVAPKEIFRAEVLERRQVFWPIEEEKKEKNIFSRKDLEKKEKTENIFPVEKKKKDWRKIGKIMLSLAILGVVFWLAVFVLPRANIKITMKKTSLTLSEGITAKVGANEVNTANNTVPAEIFSSRKSTAFSFPATGKKNIERKASGEVTIFNAYSSDSQALVVGTRFSDPDGKIFRIEKNVNVPGAKIVEGKITPSSVKVNLVADKPGQEYNVGPVDRFTIPGFKGTEKYQGFYAKSDSSMKGGFIGEIKIPTENDIKKAKESAEKTMKETLESFVLSQISKDFKIIDNASRFIIIKEQSAEEGDDSGNFSYFIEAEFSCFVFYQDNVLDVFKSVSKDKLGDKFSFLAGKIDYKDVRTDFDKKTLNFSADFNGTFQPEFDISGFKNEIKNKNATELKTILYSKQDIEKTDASLWPLWVKKVPGNINKIRVTVD